MIKKNIFLVFIVLIGIIPLFDLFHTGLPTTHDGKDHVARIANFYIALQEGILIPRWGANLNWGFGHPVMMFLYPLPSYFASVFHFLGFSIIDSLKIVFGITFIVSGVGMYLWIKRLLGVYPAVIAGILYMTAPYRFVNLYVRGAIGEHVSFTFIPFILYFITNLFLDKSKNQKSAILNLIGIATCTALLILAHNALSILFLMFVASYSLILSFFHRSKLKLVATAFSIFYGFLLSMFFWLPAYFEGKYTLRDIVTGGSEYAERFVEGIDKFIVPSWSYGITGYLSVQIGIVHIALIVVSAYIVLRLPKKEKMNKVVFAVTLIFFIGSLFMMLKQSDFIWKSVSVFQKFQFPWRFLSLTVLTSSVLGAFFISYIKNESKKLFAVASIILLVFIFYGSYWRANDYLLMTDSFFKSVYYGTTDTGESSPLWSVRFMEEEAHAPIEIIEGKATIQEIFRSTTKHEYAIQAEELSRVKENTLYFPGWNIYVNGKKLDPNTEIEFQDPKYRGVMTFFVDKGESVVRVVFENTKLRTFSEMTSIASLVGLLIIVIFILTRRKNV